MKIDEILISDELVKKSKQYMKIETTNAVEILKKGIMLFDIDANGRAVATAFYSDKEKFFKEYKLVNNG